MKGKMKVALMTGIGKIEMVERPIPQPKEDEVLVKVEYVGICGSDLHYFEAGRIGDFIVKAPLVLGHRLKKRAFEEVAFDMKELDLCLGL